MKAYCGSIPNKSLQQRQREAVPFGQWQQSRTSLNSNPIRTIPVVFHLLEYDPVITNEDVERAVSSLNNAFSHSQNDPNGADFSGGPRGVDTRIQFCLAQRAPDGGLTTGIVRWRTDYENMDVDLEDAKLKTQGQWDPRHYLNIWVLNHLDTEQDQSYTGRTWWNRVSNLGGYSGGPGGVVGPDAKTDGVIVVGMGAALVAHEIGHYLDLAHTFSSDCANGDCTVNGDGICDTPPDKSKTGCDQNTCNTDTLSNYSNGHFRTDVPDMTSNFMDYSSCPSEFTQGQADKMFFVIDHHRIDLAVEAPSNNDACNEPCNADFRIEFAVSERYPQPNVPIDLTTSTLGTGIDTYEWHIERLGSPGFDYPIAWLKGYAPSSPAIGTTPNLQHTFTEPGKFRVYVKAWNSSNPDCFASYSRILRVTCLGIDARFTPHERFIAAKQPKGKLIDTVLFRNRSVHATSFEWTVQHLPYDSMAPAQPDFISTEVDLNHTFLEPGDYLITLIAKNGDACQDTCGPFLLPVVDPTIDGEINITGVDCYYEDSLRIRFKMTNSGYDTIRVGTPLTFYDEDPRNANPTPKALGTYHLERVVYGKDRPEHFTIVLPVTRAKLDQLWAVFNDTTATSFPISWPMSDHNVMSVKSEFPPSGHNELDYDNNYSQKMDYQFRIDLEVQGDIQCTDQTAQLSATYLHTDRLQDIEWIPNTGLSCSDCLDPILTLPNEDYTQEVILTSEYYCKDTVSLFIPTIKEEVPLPVIFNIPNQCIGAPGQDLASFVEGENLMWYENRNSENGNRQSPALETGVSGTFSFWVSQTINACEGPRAEVSYSVNAEINAPTIDPISNVCVNDPVPDLAALFSGNHWQWYEQASGGVSRSEVPTLQSDRPGTIRYWVSQGSGGCESPRSELSFTVVSPSLAPMTPDTLQLCFDGTPPDLASVVPGTSLQWYTQESGDVGTPQAPLINTLESGATTIWVSQTAGQCESPKAPFTYKVADQVPPPPHISTIDLCVGDPPPNLKSLLSDDAFLWYTDHNQGVGNTDPPTLSTDMEGRDTFWVRQLREGCESLPTAVPFKVNPIPNPPTLQALPNLCIGDPVPEVSQYINGTNLSWYDSPGSRPSQAAPVLFTDSARTFTYWASQQIAGCESPLTPMELTIAAINIATGGPYEVVEGEHLEMAATITVFPEGEPFSVRWLDPSGAVIATDQLSTTVTPAEPTYYTILAETEGCLTEQDLFVDLIYQIDPTKLFSPNGDGKNDYWYIDDIDQYPEANLTVFNRWGSVVYQSRGYQNDWPGTAQDGKALPVATYYFVIELNNDHHQPVTGSVTIIR